MRRLWRRIYCGVVGHEVELEYGFKYQSVRIITGGRCRRCGKQYDSKQIREYRETQLACQPMKNKSKTDK